MIESTGRALADVSSALTSFRSRAMPRAWILGAVAFDAASAAARRVVRASRVARSSRSRSRAGAARRGDALSRPPTSSSDAGAERRAAALRAHASGLIVRLDATLRGDQGRAVAAEFPRRARADGGVATPSVPRPTRSIRVASSKVVLGARSKSMQVALTRCASSRFHGASGCVVRADAGRCSRLSARRGAAGARRR